MTSLDKSLNAIQLTRYLNVYIVKYYRKYRRPEKKILYKE